MNRTSTAADKYARYPLGAAVKESQLISDPYAVYKSLLEQETVSWIEDLNMWYVVKHAHVSQILMNPDLFTTASKNSTIRDTFGPQMLSVEGQEHLRYKTATRAPFRPKAIKETLEPGIQNFANSLVDSFCDEGGVELRKNFASILPVRTMLLLFGLPVESLANIRRWYDMFEKALSNFKGDQDIRAAAQQCANDFHDHLQIAIAHARQSEDPSFLRTLLSAPEDKRLSEEEILCNALIIFFGGISTVEALILNTVYALSTHPNIRERMLHDPTLTPQIIEETVRWHSPVQSATRHVVEDCEFHGHQFCKGDIVNCMLGAANRDPDVFPNPDVMDIDRRPEPRHLGFATGPHACLGLHLARAEARIAIETLYARLPGLTMNDAFSIEPQGYEFHQPHSLHVVWDGATG